MSKSLFLSSVFALFSIAAFANSNELDNSNAAFNVSATPYLLDDCTFTEKGTLSCGIGYTICGKTRNELDELYAELDCLNCDNCVDENDNPAPGN